MNKTHYDESDDIAGYWDKNYVAWLREPQWGVLAQKDAWFEERLAHLLPPITATPAGRVLDLGCGNAMFAVALLRRYQHYVGTETSIAALAVANAYFEQRDEMPRMTLSLYADVTEELRHLEHYGVGMFDAVITITVLQHQPPLLRRKLIEIIKHVLKPGGLYVGLEWNDANTAAYDMPPFPEADWVQAWQPLEIVRDVVPAHPDWYANNVWFTRHG